MKNRIIMTVVAAALLMPVAALRAAGPDGGTPADMLRKIDQGRVPRGASESEIVITPIKDGTAQEPGHYVIKTNGDGLVLVEALNADQRGQKFLSTDSGLFFFAPRTKRAIRITPLQSLRGQASIGDISRLQFDRDYDIGTVGQLTKCEEFSCITMDLASKSEAATYSRLSLDVKRAHDVSQLVGARLYLASGKLSKTVNFSAPANGLPPAALYIDAIDKRMETRVEYVSIKSAHFPSSLFNPRALEQ